MLPGLFRRLGVLGQQHVSVGAVGRDFQGLAGQPNLLGAGGLEGPVHHLLGTIQRGFFALFSAQAGRNLPHDPFHRTPVRQHRLQGILFLPVCLAVGFFFFAMGRVLSGDQELPHFTLLAAT